MANTYYDSQLTAAEIEAALEAIDGLIVPANNGKVIAINNGKFEARSVQWGGGSAVVQPLSVTQNGTYNPPSGVDGYAPVAVNVSGGGISFVGDFNIGYNTSAGMNIYQNRVASKTGNSNYRSIYLSPEKMSSIGLDPTKDFEIGCAFKLKDTNNLFTLFAVIANSSHFAAFPSMEVSRQLDFGRGYALSANVDTAWTNYTNFTTVALNTWYFARMRYDATNQSLTSEITTDFVSFVSDVATVTGGPKLNSTYGFGFGAFGTATDRSATAMIDLYNTYIKKENTIVFGCFTGQFPTDV